MSRQAKRHKKRLLIVLLWMTLLIADVFSPAVARAAADETDNLLVIGSYIQHGEPLPGFAYEVMSEDGCRYQVDLRQRVSAQLKLPDGEYVIRETERPTGYQKAPDLHFRFPYTDKEGVEHNRLKVFPKHLKDEGGHPHTEPTSRKSTHMREITNTGERTDAIHLYIWGAMLVLLGIRLYRKKIDSTPKFR